MGDDNLERYTSELLYLSVYKTDRAENQTSILNCLRNILQGIEERYDGIPRVISDKRYVTLKIKFLDLIDCFDKYKSYNNKVYLSDSIEDIDAYIKESLLDQEYILKMFKIIIACINFSVFDIKPSLIELEKKLIQISSQSTNNSQVNWESESVEYRDISDSESEYSTPSPRFVGTSSSNHPVYAARLLRANVEKHLCGILDAKFIKHFQNIEAQVNYLIENLGNPCYGEENIAKSYFVLNFCRSEKFCKSLAIIEANLKSLKNLNIVDEIINNRISYLKEFRSISRGGKDLFFKMYPKNHPAHQAQILFNTLKSNGFDISLSKKAGIILKCLQTENMSEIQEYYKESFERELQLIKLSILSISKKLSYDLREQAIYYIKPIDSKSKTIEKILLEVGGPSLIKAMGVLFNRMVDNNLLFAIPKDFSRLKNAQYLLELCYELEKVAKNYVENIDALPSTIPSPPPITPPPYLEYDECCVLPLQNSRCTIM